MACLVNLNRPSGDPQPHGNTLDMAGVDLVG
jgi:hypothetical protein